MFNFFNLFNSPQTPPTLSPTAVANELAVESPNHPVITSTSSRHPICGKSKKDVIHVARMGTCQI